MGAPARDALALRPMTFAESLKELRLDMIKAPERDRLVLTTVKEELQLIAASTREAVTSTTAAEELRLVPIGSPAPGAL